jgi:hypothetical protein
MRLARGLTNVQETYFRAQATLGNDRKVIETIPFYNPETEDNEYLAKPSALTKRVQSITLYAVRATMACRQTACFVSRVSFCVG